jgi:hypothetical protein
VRKGGAYPNIASINQIKWEVLIFFIWVRVRYNKRDYDSFIKLPFVVKATLMVYLHYGKIHAKLVGFIKQNISSLFPETH